MKSKYRTIGGPGVVIYGNINSEIPIIISGDIEGNIVCGNNVTINEEATIEGNITAKSITVEDGLIRGNVRANKVTLHSKAVLYGDIAADVVSILPGALFQGKCNVSACHETLKENRKK